MNAKMQNEVKRKDDELLDILKDALLDVLPCSVILCVLFPYIDHFGFICKFLPGLIERFEEKSSKPQSFSVHWSPVFNDSLCVHFTALYFSIFSRFTVGLCGSIWYDNIKNENPTALSDRFQMVGNIYDPVWTSDFT
jgi:hypothetical protein